MFLLLPSGLSHFQVFLWCLEWSTNVISNLPPEGQPCLTHLGRYLLQSWRQHSQEGQKNLKIHLFASRLHLCVHRPSRILPLANNSIASLEEKGGKVSNASF